MERVCVTNLKGNWIRLMEILALDNSNPHKSGKKKSAWKNCSLKGRSISDTWMREGKNEMSFSMWLCNNYRGNMNGPPKLLWIALFE